MKKIILSALATVLVTGAVVFASSTTKKNDACPKTTNSVSCTCTPDCQPGDPDCTCSADCNK